MSLNFKRPDVFEWYLDYQLGGRIVAEALRAHGLIVHVHSDYFAPDAPDQEWLTAVGNYGWIVLTKDRMIQRRSVEREALIRANIRAFVLVAKDTNGPENAQIFIRAHAAMMKYIEQYPAPFIVRVYRDGLLNPVDLERLASPEQ